MKSFLIFFALGFLAELIDGTMGMAYGVSSNTFLRSVGISSATSSACVHIAELFTTFVSGISHIRLKNVCKDLFKKLLIPGIIGGIIGAYLLVSFESNILDIIIDVYLIIMGIIIISKIFKKNKPRDGYGKFIPALGFVGGISDALGGGGWGPVVTSTLIATDHNPRTTIGTVNTVEFFVTIAETTTFVAMLGSFSEYIIILAGLIIGGVLAAPIGAYLCKYIPIKVMLAIVGTLVIVLNIYKFSQHIHLVL